MSQLLQFLHFPSVTNLNKFFNKFFNNFLREELVRAALADWDETFVGGQGPCQERLSPEQARSAQVRLRKGRETQIWAISD